ncbi:DUF2000 domain-containing protein [Mycobacterium hodleri]|uniref:DUF2000 domain-containing protein n=1 Tax=Mycolicibacterium hodleri TaxID=49897 RepID=UPI0021F27808|nr:DUF2000 domain-containing protein [Mycolicibacterium hodleri]MCV7133919.1 DUF2000 domain-containing protein [Mycolicibacterium hodleri]
MSELSTSTGTVYETTRLHTKIAVILDDALPTWQKLNVTAFLASGIAATAVESIGLGYEDADGTGYTPMFGQPVMVFGADKARLIRTLNRAVDRGVTPAIFTTALFDTGHDEANRAAVAAVRRAELDVAGLAVRAERKVVDAIVDGLKLHR